MSSLQYFTFTVTATETDEAVLSYKSDSSDYKKLVGNISNPTYNRSTNIYMYDWWAQQCYG